MGGGNTSVDMVRKAFDDLKEGFVSIVQKKNEQHARLREMQQATAVQDEKLSALQQQLTELKQKVAARQSRVAARATTGATPPHVAPEPQREGAGVAEVKKVYTNAGITFSRELLLSCLNGPLGGSMDIRMKPCLEELARELGRPTSSNAGQSQTSSTNPNTPWSYWKGEWYFWNGGWRKYHSSDSQGRK
ncbi:GLYK [Symbiodinium sp. CCMP2456]|nr:GLYK [Symbiodinium sp. CCMP2456]